jgi:hypothetical protein
MPDIVLNASDEPAAVIGEDDADVIKHRIRREGRGLRRRYVLMEIDPDGAVTWEWEPLSRWTLNRRLINAGWHTTDISDHLQWADDEWRQRSTNPPS